MPTALTVLPEGESEPSHSRNDRRDYVLFVSPSPDRATAA
jgi:hypothetical protein